MEGNWSGSGCAYRSRMARDVHKSVWGGKADIQSGATPSQVTSTSDRRNHHSHCISPRVTGGGGGRTKEVTLRRSSGGPAARLRMADDSA